MLRLFRLVYVFDVRYSEGYVVRVPVLLAWLICRHAMRPLDYAPTPDGYGAYAGDVKLAARPCPCVSGSLYGDCHGKPTGEAR